MSRSLVLNCVVCALALAVLAAIAIAYVQFPHLYALALYGWGVGVPMPYHPFSDFSEVLSAADCTRQGTAIYPVDPCDLWHRPHNYPVLMSIWTPLIPSADWLNVCGLALAAAVIVTVSFSSRLRSFPEALVLLAALASPTMAFAAERANLDELVLVMLALAALLAARRKTALSSVVILVAGLLKLYPIVAGIAALGSRTKRGVATLAAMAILFALFLFASRHDLAIAMPSMATGDPLSADFGMRHFVTILTAMLGFFLAPTLANLLALAAGLLTLVLMIFFAVRLSRRQSPADTEFYPGTSFLVGGIALLAVFLPGSTAYRGILMLLLLPLLLERRRSEAKPDRVIANLLIAGVVLLSWMPAMFRVEWPVGQRLMLFWFVKEPLWLATITLVASLVWSQAIQFPIMNSIAKLLPPSLQRKAPLHDI